MRRLFMLLAVGAFVLVPGAVVLARASHARTGASVGSAVPNGSASAAAVRRYDADLAALDTALDRMRSRAAAGDVAATRSALLQARIAYKRVEILAEHYTPLTARAMNGPPVPTADDENPRVLLPPTGLQVIERALGEPRDAGLREAALREAEHESVVLRVNARRLREVVHSLVIADAQLFDAARLELARLVTLGIAGADTQLVDAPIREAAASLDAIGGALDGYAPQSPAHAAFLGDLAAARRYLDERRDLGAFDRYEFITRYANPLAHAIAALRLAAGVPALTDRRPLAAHAVTVFDADAFDAQAYAPPDAPPPNDRMIALGRTLFHERALSGAGDRSCATCHRPERAFSDGLTRAASIDGRGTVGTRNTPSLIAAALQPRVLADSRLTFLEDQVAHVIGNPAEMGSDVRAAAARVAARPDYRDAFVGAFAVPPDRAVTPRALEIALAAYVRSLHGLDSPFDRAMRGGAPLAAAEQRGFNVFLGKGRCGTCHFTPLFGGTVPPGFTDAEVEVIGVPSTAAWRGATVDPDRGVGAVDGTALHDHAFRTPSLRNVARTAPYMHNGVYRTLEEVVELYDRGGGAGVGARLPNQTLAPDRLHLTRGEKRDLVAFLRALSDVEPPSPR